MPPLDLVLAACALISVALILWQHGAARRFPTPVRSPQTAPIPRPVSLLKPLKGCNASTATTLASWFRLQHDAPVQILFGVATPSDPVCSLVEELLRQHPNADARLVICPADRGANPKVSILVQLAADARYDRIVISDADVLAPQDLLGCLLPPLEDPTLGLVHCLYRLPDRFNLAMRLEALAVNADFWSQVLQAYTLGPVDFGLGAVMAFRRDSLALVGGFGAAADYLADDFRLGNLIASRGLQIGLCASMVDCRSPRMTTDEVWQRQLRWARTIRSSKPVAYFLSLLANATLWPAAWWGASGGAAPAAAFFVTALVLRVATASWQVKRCLSLDSWPADAFLAPIKDLLQAALWLAAFTGNRIRWSNQPYRILAGGRLRKETAR